MPAVRSAVPSHALKGLCLLLSSLVAVSLAALTPTAANAATGMATTTTTLQPSQTRAAYGSTTTLTVSVHHTADGSVANGTVRLYRRTSTSTPWQWAASIVTSAGVARYSYRSVTTYRWHASFAGNSVDAPSASSSDWTVAVSVPSLATRVLKEAATHAGAPYQWGASGPTRFDCSGFTRYVFGRFGKSLPHNSGQQYSVVRHISRSSMQVGDLIFIHNSSGSIYHVSIYAGNGYIWSAPHTGSYVKKQKIWSSSYYVGRVG